MKKNITLIVLILSILGVQASFTPQPLLAEQDPRIKVLMQEGLRLSTERQYIRALDLFKQVQRIDPNYSEAKFYVEETEKKIMEWENQAGLAPERGSKPLSWDKLINRKGDPMNEFGISNAKDIIAARRSLVEQMRNRSSNTENIVKIQDSKRGLSITFYHDQLFLPGLQTLRDEALPILENVAQLIRQAGSRSVSIRSLAHTDSKDPFLLYPEFPVPSADPTLPQMESSGTSVLFKNIEAIRSFMLFTYLAQRSMGMPKKPEER